uniref:Uncharacterized protein n=1 Tax=Heterorhabditis bacteriophora TaxID=37862 RepID=A0A1I7WQI0_HETBA
MNNCVANNYSARLRSRSKQPIYTSDKRAKFTQRENKKVRTTDRSTQVFPAEINANKSIPIHKTPIISARTPRESSVPPIYPTTTSSVQYDQKICSCQQQETTKASADPQARINLVTILEEGTKSMESSASFENDRTN